MQSSVMDVQAAPRRLRHLLTPPTDEELDKAFVLALAAVAHLEAENEGQ